MYMYMYRVKYFGQPLELVYTLLQWMLNLILLTHSDWWIINKVIKKTD